ncbi:MAG: hypothetical protein EVJ47_06535 [Candidatus Acidulodesulfobacterium ferriphilum]|jgi:hypothetical protein|uniref:Uncharacterized protein n=1 Tax=Candidatus Acidulodesulfobacterium ferriphilum TaxID=2597223 RepID=A0A519BAK0_9DELT|nr:MAG: hypothetical protein EVJ47_06535 [Candidatus Acidulodesulfobacterium ferriphilum]
MRFKLNLKRLRKIYLLIALLITFTATPFILSGCASSGQGQSPLQFNGTSINGPVVSFNLTGPVFAQTTQPSNLWGSVVCQGMDSNHLLPLNSQYQSIALLPGDLSASFGTCLSLGTVNAGSLKNIQVTTPPPLSNGSNVNVLTAYDLNTTVPVQVSFTDDTCLTQTQNCYNDYMGIHSTGHSYLMGYYSLNSTKENDPWLLGNKGNYVVTIQEFIDVIPSLQPGPSPSIPQNITTCPQGQTCTNGPDGQMGYWVPLNAQTTYLYGSSATSCGNGDKTCLGNDIINSGNQASQRGAVSQTLEIPVDLLHAAALNYLRVVITGYEGDTRPWPEAVWHEGNKKKKGYWTSLNNQQGYNFDTGVAWNKGRIIAGQHCVKTNTPGGRKTICNIIDYGYHSGNHNFNYSVFSEPFAVQVEPIAVVQLAAVPYAIEYMPPGSKSYLNYSDTMTEGTQFQIGENGGVSNASGSVTGTCTGTNLDFNLGIFGVGGGFKNSDLNCNSSSNSSGTSQGTSTADTDYIKAASTNGNKIYSEGYIPGNYFKEAFWNDVFELDIDQPYAVYDDNGNSVTRFLPVTGYPDLASITVAELAACAAGETSITITGLDGTPQTINPCQAGFIVANPPKPMYLTGPQALSLLSLDPFYPTGQSFDPSSSPTSSNPNRFTIPQNIPTKNCGPYNITSQFCGTEIKNSTEVSGTAGNQTGIVTGVTVANTNKNASDWDINLTGTYKSVSAGVSVGGTTVNILGTSNSSGAQMNYYNSTTLSVEQAITFQTEVADSNYYILILSPSSIPTPSYSNCADNFKNNLITLYPYQDNNFSTLLFRDPCAPSPPFPFHPSLKRGAPMPKILIQKVFQENPYLVNEILKRRQWQRSQFLKHLKAVVPASRQGALDMSGKPLR